ncbi:hypothetical protein V2J09_001794 [Rumex salicifolius]
MEQSMSENSCQLCAVEKLTFEPPPIYCSRYGCRIKRNAMYYTFGVGDTRHYFCFPCYIEARGDTIMVEGTAVPKSRLEKKKNDEETEEWWVQCDKCEAWQHQICALYNGRRNDGGQAEYTCPNCYIEEIENWERKPLPQSAVLGAKDLPRTILSDHIEQRLFKRLKYERQERVSMRYLAMLKKATKETGERKAKVTAARLPYFDGDYWPGAAEQLNQEEDGRKQNKKGTTKKAFTKRALKASGQSDPSSNASKDLLLMHKFVLLQANHSIALENVSLA